MSNPSTTAALTPVTFSLITSAPTSFVMSALSTLTSLTHATHSSPSVIVKNNIEETNFLGQIRDGTVCENETSRSALSKNTLVINTSESEGEEPPEKKIMFNNFTKLKCWSRCRTLTKQTNLISSFKTHLIGRRKIGGETIKILCLDPYYIVAVCESPCQFHSGILSDLSAPDFKFLEHECDSGYDLF